MPFAKINGVNLHYRVEGNNPDEVLVFSNSLGTDFRIWDGLVSVLRNMGVSAQIIRYDKRGHGLSDAPPQPYSMDDHVGDLAALHDHLGVKNTTVFGLSVGGLIAQGLVASRPDLVKAIVLSDTAHKIGDDKLWNDRIETINKNGIPALAQGILERWFSPPYRQSDNPDFACYTNMLVRTPVDGYCGTSAAIRDCDYTEVARQITVPTLLIVGSNDGSTPPDLVRSTHNLIANSSFEIIDGPGHLPCVEDPVATAEVFLKFYNRLGN